MAIRMRIFLCAGLFVLVSASMTFAQTTHIVRQDGQGGAAFTDLATAVSTAASGDTISVEDPSDVTYDEPTMVLNGKDLDIVKNTNATITLTKSAGPSGRNQGLFYVTNSTALVSGFQIFDTTGVAMEADAGAVVTMEDCLMSGCDGNSTLDFDDQDEATIDVHDGGSLTMNDCEINDSLRTGHDFGPAISLIFGGTVVCNNCRIVTEPNPNADGNFDLFDCALIAALDGTMTLNDCLVEADGANAIFVGGLGSLTTVNLNRCIITPNDNNAAGTMDILANVALADGVLNATNTVFDAKGQQTDSTQSCVHIGVEGYINLNYCDLIRGQNGMIMEGDPVEVKTTNSLVGLNDEWGVKWILGGGFDVDTWFESNHFWANPTGHYPTAVFPGNNSMSDVDNTLGEEPDGSDAPWAGIDPTLFNYQVLNELEVADLGVSALLGTTVADLDEISVRPRGSANDKGAQEGFLIPNPASVGTSWSVYR